MDERGEVDVVVVVGQLPGAALVEGGVGLVKGGVGTGVGRQGRVRGGARVAEALDGTRANGLPL